MLTLNVWASQKWSMPRQLQICQQLEVLAIVLIREDLTMPIRPIAGIDVYDY
jgi:uncharacterized membrane protein affecting hemolysin expression